MVWALLFSLIIPAFANDWSIHQSNLKGMIAKIRTHEKKIFELSEEKGKTRDPNRLNEIFVAIKGEHGKLKTAYKDFEAEKNHVRFEHPAEGDATEKKYHRYRLRTVEQIESEGGVDGRINQVSGTIRSTYQGEGAPVPTDDELDPECNCKREEKDGGKKPAPTASPMFTPIKVKN